jgi:hypothetical protein
LMFVVVSLFFLNPLTLFGERGKKKKRGNDVVSPPFLTLDGQVNGAEEGNVQ